MKKLLFLSIVAASLAACNNESKNAATATDGSVSVVLDSTPVVSTPVVTYNEGDISRRDGKVVVYKNNDWVVIDKDYTLDNGIIITPAGNMKTKDGKTVVLEDGYHVTKAGRFFDKAGNAIENAWDATKGGVKTAAEATKDGAQKVAEGTKEAAQKTGEAIKTGVQKTGEAIKTGAQKVGDKTKEVVNDIKN